MKHGRRPIIFYAMIIALLSACAPREETVPTDTLITRGEVFNEKGERISYSDFTYNDRCLMIAESHYAGERLTKVTLEYDDQDRLKTRIDANPGAHPVRLDYAYAADGQTVTITQTSEGQPAGEMNNLYENGVLVGRNWGKEHPNALVFKLETTANKIVRRTYLADGALGRTETMTFDDGEKLASVEYESKDRTESRRFTYDGRRLIESDLLDGRGKVTETIKFSYSPVKVLKRFAGTYNYLFVDDLLAEVKGSKAK